MSGTACQCQETSRAEIEIDYSLLDKIIRDDYGENRESMIMMMQAIQRIYRFLPEATLKYLAQVIQVPLTKIYEVATFYASFSLEPKGKYILSVCTGTACHLRGSGGMVEHVSKRMGISPGKTTADLKMTLETVNCVGACAVAPVVVIDEKYYPKADIATLNHFMDHLDAE
jgi:NADH:ubiquinone oxidoreductase subunit E